MPDLRDVHEQNITFNHINDHSNLSLKSRHPSGEERPRTKHRKIISWDAEQSALRERNVACRTSTDEQVIHHYPNSSIKWQVPGGKRSGPSSMVGCYNVQEVLAQPDLDATLQDMYECPRSNSKGVLVHVLISEHEQVGREQQVAPHYPIELIEEDIIRILVLCSHYMSSPDATGRSSGQLFPHRQTLFEAKGLLPASIQRTVPPAGTPGIKVSPPVPRGVPWLSLHLIKVVLNEFGQLIRIGEAVASAVNRTNMESQGRLRMWRISLHPASPCLSHNCSIVYGVLREQGGEIAPAFAQSESRLAPSCVSRCMTDCVMLVLEGEGWASALSQDNPLTVGNKDRLQLELG
eukprot:6459376-Amphidinium_carterae.2